MVWLNPAHTGHPAYLRHPWCRRVCRVRHSVSAIANKVCVPDDGDAGIFVHVLNPRMAGFAESTRTTSTSAEIFTLTMRLWWRVRWLQSHAFNPESAEWSPLYFFCSSLAKIILWLQHVEAGVTEGQYVYPRGLFSVENSLKKDPGRTWIGWEKPWTRRFSLRIDVHTGLGKSGEDTLLIDAGKDDPSYQNLARILETESLHGMPTNRSYQINGGHPAAVCRQLGRRRLIPSPEFGTIAGKKVLYALRQENRWHQWGNGDLKHSSKQGLLDAFRPDTDRWRASVLRQGIELYNRSKNTRSSKSKRSLCEANQLMLFGTIDFTANRRLSTLLEPIAFLDRGPPPSQCTNDLAFGEGPLKARILLPCLLTAPRSANAHSESSKSRAECCGLEHGWSHQFDAEKVGLKLHEQIVGDSPSVDLQLGQRPIQIWLMA